MVNLGGAFASTELRQDTIYHTRREVGRIMQRLLDLKCSYGLSDCMDTSAEFGENSKGGLSASRGAWESFDRIVLIAI